MARRVRLLPIASAGSEPELSITENWGQIEKAYGHSLDDAVRKRILEATTSFVYFEVFERTAKPVRHAIDAVSSVRSAAKALFHALAGSHNGSDASFYAKHLINRNFDDPRLRVSGPGNDPLNALTGVLTTLAAACNLALEEMETSDATGHREGDCWENWIRRLTRISEENGLPWRVSKGSDKSTQESPFTRLVATLQECVPRDARRHRSNAALAKAINEARRRPKRDG